MSFYTDMAATASSLLAQFGATVTIKRDNLGTTDPVTGVYTPGTTDNLTANGVTTRITKEDRDAFGEVQGNDRLLILDSQVKPLEGDRVQVGSENWNTISIQESNPAGTPLVYRVLIRK